MKIYFKQFSPNYLGGMRTGVRELVFMPLERDEPFQTCIEQVSCENFEKSVYFLRVCRMKARY